MDLGWYTFINIKRVDVSSSSIRQSLNNLCRSDLLIGCKVYSSCASAKWARFGVSCLKTIMGAGRKRLALGRGFNVHPLLSSCACLTFHFERPPKPDFSRHLRRGSLSSIIMSASRKRIAREEGKDDIVSKLPKYLLDNILERLPIRDAVRTSILSRKWRYLWSARTTLVFNEEFFETNFRYRTNPANAYTILIHDILLLRTEPVLKFTLHIPNISWNWDLHIDKWLLFLSRHGINEIALINMSVNPYKLPSCVFSCPNLNVLRVTNCVFKPLDKGCKFANLHTLIFKYMSFSPDVSVLVFPVLKRLGFLGCRAIENFKIFAPKLNYFLANYSHDVKSFSLDKFPSLATVGIAIRNKVYEQERDRLFIFCNILEKLPAVNYLVLNGAFLKLSAAITLQRRLPFMLHHLTRLELHGIEFDDADHISCVLCLLRSSPSLKTLIILVLPSKGTALELDSSLFEASDCMDEMLNLQIVRCYSSGYSKTLLLLVKCILARSPSLRSMNFEYDFEKGDAFKISNELLRFPRASSKAEVIFSCRRTPARASTM